MRLARNAIRIVIVACALVPGAVRGQEEEPNPLDTEPGRGPNPEGWDPYMDLLEAKYVASEKEGEPSFVRLKFHVSPDVPKGGVIVLSLELASLPVAEMDYKVEEKRKDIEIEWKPKRKLPSGEFFLRTSLPLEKQTAANKATLQKNENRFPPKYEPWYYLWMREEFAILVTDGGTSPEDVCEAYGAFLDELIENMNEFVDKVEAVKEGKELTTGSRLDAAKFQEFYEGWQEKQAATQSRVASFPMTDLALFEQSRTAHGYLVNLGRMVSKRAFDAVNEVTKQYKVAIKWKRPPQYFDRNYRLAVTPQLLQLTYDRILQLVCPEEPEEPEEPGAGAPADVPPEGEGTGGEKPAETPPG